MERSLLCVTFLTSIDAMLCECLVHKSNSCEFIMLGKQQMLAVSDLSDLVTMLSEWQELAVDHLSDYTIQTKWQELAVSNLSDLYTIGKK